FDRENDYLNTINGGPWLYGKTMLHLAKCRPGLDMNFFEPNAYLVWVKVPDLALEFWEVEVLRGIANAIGYLLAIDPMTLARTRMAV
ncbi:hypothetical protein KI387_038237, partial [Taxus chinensis]